MKSRIRQIRERAGLSQTEFAERIGLTKNYMSLLETGGRKPSDRTVSDICREFGINKEWLLTGNGEMQAPDEVDAITEVCRQYGAGDAVGKIFKAVMDVPSSVRNEFAELLLDRLQQPTYKVRTIAFFNRQASAGPGQIVFDDVQDTIDIENNERNARVVYAVGVSGDSMEPVYSDGDVLLVTKDECEVGDIGIFYHDGQHYVKTRGETELISQNPAYAPIKMNEGTRCLGRVLGKA